MRRLSFWTVLFALLMLLTARVAQAQQSPSPGQAAEAIRTTLVQILLHMRDDPAGARVRLDTTRTRYTTTLAPESPHTLRNPMRTRALASLLPIRRWLAEMKWHLPLLARRYGRRSLLADTRL